MHLFKVDPMDQIFGIIERITFYNGDNGFTVARLKMPRKNDLVTIVGNLPALQPGEQVRCTGTWKTNSSHGMQFEVTACVIEAPTDLVGLQKYLGSGLIQGIGPSYAEKIIQKFGLKTLSIIDQNPEMLLEIPGIGQKRMERIKESWDSQKTIREVMIFLQKYGVSPLFAHKIYKTFGNEAIEKVQENPYELAKSVSGIGFKMADKIASEMGYQKTTESRIDSGIEYLLSELSADGHVCYPLSLFMLASQEKLEVPLELIQERIAKLIQTEKIVSEKPLEEELISLKKLHITERGVAREIKRLKSHPCTIRSIDAEKALEWVEKELHIALADHQKDAIAYSMQDKVHIITGGPGTGKSTITKSILAISIKLTRKIVLAAPTGRAAKRMSEITRRQAFTIHSLLQYDFKERGFRHNPENPLQGDLFIIDEASMIDTSLMYHLLRAIPDRARVLLVGDIHQLPSIGPGNVLKDMIESGEIPFTRLTKIFRQAAGSKIITNAHKINEGRFPDVKSEEKGDFFFIQAEEPPQVLQEIISLVSKRLPEKYGFNAVDEIQVLAPMKKGLIGTGNLNLALQEALNPSKEYVMMNGTRFAPGDKVMQMKNNYNKEVYNGDIGRLRAIDAAEKTALITFDGKDVPYEFHELDEVSLAYACSIHKYQGSECPCVVIPIHQSHFVMLHRNLLYTGVTRGKRLVVLVGTMKAIAMAVGNDEVKKRYTNLQYQLKQC